jgi:hypothetical protein
MNIRLSRFLLLIPYIGLLSVQIYDRHDPVLLGFPFFYWYQLAWVPLTSLVLWAVYKGLSNVD